MTNVASRSIRQRVPYVLGLVGLAAKARLLAHEGVDMRRLHMPQTGTAL